MLDALRKRASGWVAQLLIALLVLSFAVWGVSDIFTGFRGDTAATVGGTDISLQQFAREYDGERRRLETQLRQPISAEQANLFGLPGQALGRLVSQATLDDQADALRLGISGDRLAQEIADDPAFQGAGSTFDRARFAELLRSAGYTEDQYVEQLREGYVRQQIVDALIGGFTVPETYLRALHDYSTEERDVSYLILSPDAVEDVGTPSETELSEYFEANKADWQAPEYRAIRIMTLTPADLADTSTITDEAARELYDSQVATRFTTPERRRVSQIIFSDRAEADEAAAALAAGKTFDGLVAERQLKPEDVDLGLVSRDAIIDPAVAEAAFSLEANAVSEVVGGRFGPVLIRVTAIEPQSVKPFETVTDQLKQELAEDRAASEIADLLDVIADARAGGQTLDEIATAYELDIVEIPALDSSGKDADGVAVPDLPGGSEMVSAVFETDIGIENDPMAVGDGYAWYEVTDVQPAHDRELAEVRDKVVEAWRRDQIDEALTAKADDLRDRIAGGTDIAAVAGEQGVSVATAQGLTRNGPPPAELSGAALQAAFGGPVGHVTVAPAAEPQAKAILVVTDVTIPPFSAGTPELAQGGQQLSAQIADDLMTQYIAQLQDRLGVRVNQAALQQVLGPSGS